jgi:hypothetical protein
MSSPSKHERLRWQKSAEREWDVRLVVVEEQEEAHQGCEVQLLQQQQNMVGFLFYLGDTLSCPESI